MDALASRGQNKVYQNTPAITLPNQTVYTGAGTQQLLSKSAIPIIVGILALLLILGFIK